ncbi:MAG: hypothetical protein MZW92_49180 [Comamonadaceae bacterium]|nr:hypothetical protein [Comamonadaceae bacterium]
MNAKDLDGGRADVWVRILEKFDQRGEDVRRVDLLHGKDRLDPHSAFFGLEGGRHLIEILERLQPLQSVGRRQTHPFIGIAKQSGQQFAAFFQGHKLERDVIVGVE